MRRVGRIHEHAQAHRTLNRCCRARREGIRSTDIRLACAVASSRARRSSNELTNVPAECAMRLAHGVTGVEGQQEYFSWQAGYRGGAPVKVIICVSIWMVRDASSRTCPKYTSSMIMMRVTDARIHGGKVEVEVEGQVAIESSFTAGWLMSKWVPASEIPSASRE